MIVVHIIADLSRGGAEVALKRLVEVHRTKSDLECHIICLKTVGSVGAEVEALGVKVEALRMRGASDFPRVVAQLARRFRELRPDIVHTWMYRANLLGGISARLSGTSRVVWGIRASELTVATGVTRWTMIIRRASAFLSSSLPDAIVYVASAARKAHEAIGYAPSKGVVINNGYPPIDPRPRKVSRRELAVDDGHFLVGTVGRFNAAKDPKTFVAAAAQVAASHPETRFIMVGRDMTNANRELMAWITEYGVADRFILTGERTDVSDVLGAMDLFCLHSVTEGFPNVLAEAMGAGVPCVTTDVGDAAVLLGDCGLIVPPGDSAALARAIIQFIEYPQEDRGRYGQCGRDRVRADFTIDAIAAKYEGLYRQLLERSSALASR